MEAYGRPSLYSCTAAVLPARLTLLNRAIAVVVLVVAFYLGKLLSLSLSLHLQAPLGVKHPQQAVRMPAVWMAGFW